MRRRCPHLGRRVWLAGALWFVGVILLYSVWWTSESRRLPRPAAQYQPVFGCAYHRSVESCDLAYSKEDFSRSDFELTLVIAARNDAYGGTDLIERFQLTLDWLEAYAQEVALEVIVVEWNPDAEHAALADVIRFFCIFFGSQQLTRNCDLDPKSSKDSRLSNHNCSSRNS
jgi:hypothetical protein